MNEVFDEPPARSAGSHPYLSSTLLWNLPKHRKVRGGYKHEVSTRGGKKCPLPVTGNQAGNEKLRAAGY